MAKNSKLLNLITLVGVLVVLAIVFMRYFYETEYGIPAVGVPKLLGIIMPLTINAMAALAVSAHVFNLGKFNKKFLLLIMLLVMSLVMSFHNAGWSDGRFAVISIPITFIFIIGILTKYKLANTSILLIKYFFSFAAVLPVCLYIFVPEFKEALVSSVPGHPDAYFKGFESSRTTYGFVACLAFTLHLIDRQRGWMIFVGIICIGIFYSQSRAAVLVCAILSIYIILYDDRVRNKKTFLLIVGIAIPLFFAVFVYSGIRQETDMLHDAGRLWLLQHHIEYAKNHLFFGAGGTYTPTMYMLSDGRMRSGGLYPAHNFILETLTGFGIFVTIIWIILLAYFWKRLHKMGRTYILFLILYGTLHNGFGLSVLNSANFFLLVLAVLTSSTFREGKVLHGIKCRVKRQKAIFPVLRSVQDKPGFAKPVTPLPI